MDEREVGDVEPIDNQPEPEPDIESSELLSGPIYHDNSPQISPGEEMLNPNRERGTGKIFAGGDVERAQAEALARQIERSTAKQLQYVSETLTNLRWIETDGSRQLDDDTLAVFEMEFTFANGKAIKITGPIINVEFK